MTFGLSGAALAGVAVGGATLVSGIMQSQAAGDAAAIQGAASQAGIDEQRRQFDKVQELLKKPCKGREKTHSCKTHRPQVACAVEICKVHWHSSGQLCFPASSSSNMDALVVLPLLAKTQQQALVRQLKQQAQTWPTCSGSKAQLPLEENWHKAEHLARSLPQFLEASACTAALVELLEALVGSQMLAD